MLDSVINFVKNMDAIQWGMAGLAVFLLFPTLQKYGKMFWNPTETDTGTQLTDLVCKWEALCDECHKYEMTEACEKLQEVFPMLVKGYKAEHDHNSPTS